MIAYVNKCHKSDNCKKKILGFSNGLKWFYATFIYRDKEQAFTKTRLT